MFLLYIFLAIAYLYPQVTCHNTTSMSLKRRYPGYSLFSASPHSHHDIKYLSNLKSKQSIDVIFFESLSKNPDLNYSSANNVPLLVSFKLSLRTREDLERDANFNNVQMKEVSELVSDILDHQVQEHYEPNPRDRWENFQTQENVYKWLEKLSSLFENNTRLESIGKSAENRNIYALSINNKSNHLCFKVIVVAGAHGNAWLSTSFVTYFIDQMLNSTSGPLYILREKFCWTFIPILNPDGYVYSQEQDFLWRKNRRKTDKECTGVDLERNFDYNHGTSEMECEDDRWPGHLPFSEPESMALKKFIQSRSSLLTYYFSINGFGQTFIIPYSDSEGYEGNYNEVTNLARYATRKINQYSGRIYRVGTAWDTLGLKWTGDSASWVKRQFDVPYVMTILLRDNGVYGPAIPKEEILPACNEMMVGFIELMSSEPKKLLKTADNFATSMSARNNMKAEAFLSILSLLIWLY